MSNAYDNYVDARRDRRACERALRELGPSPARTSAVMLAKAKEKAVYARLTGSEIGRLHREDAARAAASKSVAS